LERHERRDEEEYAESILASRYATISREETRLDQSNSGNRLRTLCVVASIFLLAYACLLAAKSVAGFPTSHITHTRWPWLGDKPVGEDGFYMLTVADNLATTHRLVYNYDMPATGIQPLATLLFAGIAVIVHHLGGDRWMLIRVIIVFGAILLVFFSWMMAFLAASLAPESRRQLVFGLAFFLILFDFTAFRLFTFGLETGVYLCSLAICMLIWRRLVAAPHARWFDILSLGIAAGIAGLSRIDFGLLFAVLLCFFLIKRIASLLQVLTAGLIALVIVSPWFAFVHKVTGDWLPTSGKAESRLFTSHDSDRITSVLISSVAHVVPWSFASAGLRLTTGIGFASLAVLAFFFLRARETRITMHSSIEFRATFLPWLMGIAAVAFIYIAFFWSTHFFPRYLSPLLILSIPLLALVLAEQSFVQRNPATVCAVFVFFFCAWDVASLHNGHVANSNLIAAGYIHGTYPDTRIGTFQSGVIGYFDPNVENLDGKLNQGALRAAQTHQLPAFIDSENINVLVDWPGYIESLPGDYLSRDWQTCPQAMPVPESICLIRRIPRKSR
jgi:hypothetical protein